MNLPPTGEAIVTLIELQKRLHDPGLEKAIAALATVEGTRWTYRPIDMVMHCPACGLQHVDAPEIEVHRSHLCHGCGHIWRPADVPTNGVAAVKTRGQNDSPVDTVPLRSCGKCLHVYVPGQNPSKEAMGRLLLEASTGMHGEVAKQLCDAWAEQAGRAEEMKEVIGKLIPYLDTHISKELSNGSFGMGEEMALLERARGPAS